VVSVPTEPCPVGAETEEEEPKRKKRAPSQKFEVPEGWAAKGFSFEVKWPSGEAAAKVRSHFGARRFAYNWALGQVKSDLDARGADPAHVPVGWDLCSLRRHWGAVKGVVAPWWAQCSKEAYATGIADLCTALKNWREPRDGTRKGPRAGFPKFRSRGRDHGRVRSTTGATRPGDDRRTITLPVVGALRPKESTRRLQRLVHPGRDRVLNATLSERWGRLFVSFGCIVRQHEHAPAVARRAGVDLGLRSLATVAGSDG
jgi:putative transposase